MFYIWTRSVWDFLQNFIAEDHYHLAYIKLTMNEFIDKFRSYTNTELLRIIDNPKSYQPKAVESAKKIFSERQLTEKEIKISKDELEIERQRKIEKEKNKKVVEDKFKNIGKSILDILNPIQNESLTVEKTINTISLLFAFLFGFKLYKEFHMILFMFTDNAAIWDLSMVIYFFPLVIIPIATILFYKRNKLGWLLMMIYLTFSAVSVISLFILTLNMQSLRNTTVYSTFPKITLATHLLTFLLITTLIWGISREKIRIVYSIKKQTMIMTISIVAILVGIGFKTMF